MSRHTILFCLAFSPKGRLRHLDILIWIELIAWYEWSALWNLKPRKSLHYVKRYSVEIRCVSENVSLHDRKIAKGKLIVVNRWFVWILIVREWLASTTNFCMNLWMLNGCMMWKWWRPCWIYFAIEPNSYLAWIIEVNLCTKWAKHDWILSWTLAEVNHLYHTLF